MFIFISVLVFIVAVLLILVILVQNPKGGLASNFSSSNQVMGVRKTTDFLEKATWTLGIALLILSVISSSLIGGGTKEVVNTNESELTDQANQVVIPQSQAPMIQEGVPSEQGNSASPQGDEEVPADDEAE
tara:strand:+ start:9 stop:401 length:393 start_codon:yes stop_codon:yes gene_type:complete